MLPPSSLIIPTRNRPQLLAETLQSVLGGDEVPSEVIIVDQGNGDGAAALPGGDARCAIRYLKSPSVGLSRARNEGIQAARFELLAFLDDDMLVAPGWYGALVGAVASGGRRMVTTGAVHAGAREVAGGFVPATVTRPAAQTFEGRIGTDVLAGGNMALCRAALDHVGLFDSRLGAGSRWASAEDNDFGLRLLEAGYRIRYVPDALVYHRAWRPARDYYRVRWSYGLGKGGFYTKHASMRDPHTLRRASADIGGRLAKFPALLCRARSRALGDLVYSAGILWGAAQWMMLQKWRVERARRL